MKLNKEEIKYLKLNGYSLSILADNAGLYEVDKGKYSSILKDLTENHPYYYYFYCDLDIKKEAEKIFIGEDMETKRKNYIRRYNQEKRRLIKEKYNITR